MLVADSSIKSGHVRHKTNKEIGTKEKEILEESCFTFLIIMAGMRQVSVCLGGSQNISLSNSTRCVAR
jgi:hypothetical protein